jgi:glucose/arabinose dehydrogenase
MPTATPLAAPGEPLAPPLTAVSPPQVIVETVADGLDHPWAVAFLPDGTLLITERSGQLIHFDPQHGRRTLIGGLPPLAAQGQGGLLDLVLAPDFAHSRRLYFCFAEPTPEGASRTAVARATFAPASTTLSELTILFRQEPARPDALHYGCRLLFEPDGKALLVTLGDRFHWRDEAQRLDNHLGKTVRIDPEHGQGMMAREWQQRCRDGQRATCAARPEIFTWGHRNIQGAIWHPGANQPWIVEHGPQGGDELNALVPGENYGWPLYTFGEEYGGGPIGKGRYHPAPYRAPLIHWTPSIAPSGMAFLASDRYGLEWQGAVVVGSLKFREVRWLQTVCHRILSEAVLPIGRRVRDVRLGPDGLVYLLTDEAQGQLLRLRPAGNVPP